MTASVKSIVFLFCLLSFMTACKKTGSCGNETCRENEDCINGDCRTYCGVHKHFYNGTCVCDEGWYGSGWDCDKRCSDCPGHSHCANNSCACDDGWAGNYCDIPIGSFAGNYHLTGTSVSWSGGGPSITTDIDDTLQITYHKDTLLAWGYNHLYSNHLSDTSRYFPFLWMPSSPSNYSLLQFNKSMDDSLFYQSRSGGLGAGITTQLSGKKI
jgi:hypothetical protein